MSNPARIDTHQHIVPPAYARLLRERGIRPGGIDLPAWSRDGALKMMDANHIATGILSVSTPGAYLGDPDFTPLLQELNRRAVTVFVHPGELQGPPVEGIPSFTADFLLDTTRTAISLILSGAMDRYRSIKFILAHAGGFVPYISYRIMLTMLQREPKLKQAGALLAPEHTAEKHLRVLKQFYWDTALAASPASLPALFAVAEPTHVLYGSDWPFAPAPAVKFITKQLEKYPMDAQLRAAIDRENAELLFPGL